MMTLPDDHKTFYNKLQRLRGDLETFISRVDAPYLQITETEKHRYCEIAIELLEFAVKRAENLPKEISFPHLPTWNNLQKENRVLRKQVHNLNSEQRRLSVLLESANRNIRELQDSDSQSTEDTPDDTNEDLRSGILSSRQLDDAYRSLFPIEEVSSSMEKESTPGIVKSNMFMTASIHKMNSPRIASQNGNNMKSPRFMERVNLQPIEPMQPIANAKASPRSSNAQHERKPTRTGLMEFQAKKTDDNPARKKQTLQEKQLQNTIGNITEKNSELVKQNTALQQEVHRLQGLMEAEKTEETPSKEEEGEEEEEKEVKELRNQVQSLWKLVQTLEVERKYLLNRLGRLATSRLASEGDDGESQTFTADLSDLIRPTALTLRLSEIYNNEWLFAYESMMSRVFNEKKVIGELLSCITNIFLKCQDMADKQRHKLHRESQLADGLLNPDNLLEVPIQIVELQRERALQDLPEIKQACREVLTNLKSYPKQVVRFVDKCAELCWFMNIHNPPLYLEWRILQGSLIDTSRFTFYSRSGRYVDYVVWPALLLMEDGAILSKGIVQGRG